MSIRQACILASLMCAVTVVNAQQDDPGLHDLSAGRYIEAVTIKSDRVQEKLDQAGLRALKKFQKQEMRMQRKLRSADSLKAAEIFGTAAGEYEKIQHKLDDPLTLQQYIPSLDSMNSSLKFLEQNANLLSSTAEIKEKLGAALEKVKGLEGQLQKADDIKSFLQQRQKYLKNQLSQLGFAKDLKKVNKEVYYFGAQVQEYKSLLKDQKKAERKALELLSKTKLFKDFMQKNSRLASLFRMPGNPGDPASQQTNLAGLQTRAQVNGLIQQQISGAGPGGQQQFRQNMQAAQSTMNELKNKVNQTGGGSDDIMPEGFRPNNQKSKSFLKRLELGTNIQSQKANSYFPVTSDIGLSLGYMLNDRSVIGIGGSYRVGWGKNIRHIDITHQGVGLRSFVDWKIRGSLWLSGGYEMNYRAGFDNVYELRHLDAWQQSGLVGLSKVISGKTKSFRKTKLQLMWDFLSYKQIPRVQPIVFRIGYNIR